MKLTLIAGLAMLTATSPSFAQETPAAPSAPAVSSDFSDGDIQKFALVVADARKIFADAGTPEPEKQAKLVTVLQQRGLEPEKFNAIGEAAQKDPALRQKIQAGIPAQP